MWIDADTIIKCDVVPMVRHALTTSNYTVAAVGISGKPISLSKYAQQLYPGITHTFNAGVFILERWRQRGLTEEARKISLLSKKKKLYRLGSQPPLTLVIGNDFEHLNPVWNVKVPLVKEYFKEHGDSADMHVFVALGGRHKTVVIQTKSTQYSQGMVVQVSRQYTNYKNEFESCKIEVELEVRNYSMNENHHIMMFPT
jgi:lipopolysaccharide biosynthesis glycosyltransferase